MNFGIQIGIGLAAVAAIAITVTSFQLPPAKQIQRGYRGVGMVQVFHPATLRKQLAENEVPPAEDKQEPSGQASSAVYANVQVLKDLDSNEFLRLMTAVTAWVAPNEGCTYCHDQEDLSSDKLYTKVVARRMFQMVANINGKWSSHVGTTGVTCYTCHRGNPVPKNIWFADPRPGEAHGLSQEKLAKNVASPLVGSSSLPSDVLSEFLDKSNEIRVISTVALPGTDRHSIKQTEWTYGLMMNMSQSLGVNCTYCHNSRSFFAWDQSTPQRATAWYGIRMVRELNTQYLDPLASTFPHSRLGPTGDGPKLNCATCHNGVYKPLFGESMLKDYPELGPAKEASLPPSEAKPQ
jgi:photosynthetic reaction center cytochrome c subunit